MKISERKLTVKPNRNLEDFYLKVAFATETRQKVDQHFGSARGMLIYGLHQEGWNLLEAIEYTESSTTTHDKLPKRISDLEDCAAVYCNACGAAAIRQLLDNHIHPVKVMAGTDIHELLSDLKQEVDGGPKGWLARAMKQNQLLVAQASSSEAQRYEQLMDEEW
ncbi:NifB/NifX family molybdenum-iron cluster-binding protein [Vibrio porteresiae]|uniref:NifB/NifX family molybdenum-iron cluster-binding protein n=1 Tax=Vibrio porteresiae DSM 19223 TaxID=1123496 RepID=A0ABZ0QIF9_9VIBR|nr:NifB/NifX family molybdenum-iron cluster-binding protein [Vibrio porteresiae]WPC76287.1 NifB/NifX family molybdenum-iron cluster-binding protein [Vibrio porteresiae DSM 19223]